MPYILLIVCAVLGLAYVLLRNQPGILDETGMAYLWFAFLISGAITLIHVVSYVLVDLLLARTRGQRVPSLLRLLLSVTLYTIAVIVIARVVLGVDILAIATASAVLAVIVGIALQSPMSNLFSGISMMLEWPSVIRIGDVVKVGEHSGPLEAITWRSMSLRMSTGALLVVPNTEMATQALEVFPAHEINASRISVPVPVAVPPRKVFEIVATVIRTAPGVNPAVPPVIHCGEIRITDRGDALMTYDILYYPMEYRDAIHTDAVVRERIWYAFARNDIIQSYGRKPGALSDVDVAAISEVPVLLGLEPQLGACLTQGARTHLYTEGEPILPPRAAQCSLFVVARGTVSLRAAPTDASERPETPTPSNAETSISRQRMIDRITEEYAEHIGPIAGVVVRNAARHCDDPYRLYQLLAEEIADQDSRALFLSNAPTSGSLLLRRGDHFGSAAYISGRPPQHAEMHALDEVELVELDRNSLLQAMEDDPEGATELCHRLADADAGTDAVASAAVGAGRDGPHV